MGECIPEKYKIFLYLKELIYYTKNNLLKTCSNRNPEVFFKLHKEVWGGSNAYETLTIIIYYYITRTKCDWCGCLLDEKNKKFIMEHAHLISYKKRTKRTNSKLQYKHIGHLRGVVCHSCNVGIIKTIDNNLQKKIWNKDINFLFRKIKEDNIKRNIYMHDEEIYNLIRNWGFCKKIDTHKIKNIRKLITSSLKKKGYKYHRIKKPRYTF